MFETKTAATEGPVTDRWGPGSRALRLSSTKALANSSPFWGSTSTSATGKPRQRGCAARHCRQRGDCPNCHSGHAFHTQATLALGEARDRQPDHREQHGNSLSPQRCPFPVLIFISSNISRLGYEPKELLGDRTYLELVHPEDRASAEAMLQRMLEGDGLWNPSNSASRKGRFLSVG